MILILQLPPPRSVVTVQQLTGVGLGILALSCCNGWHHSVIGGSFCIARIKVIYFDCLSLSRICQHFSSLEGEM